MKNSNLILLLCACFGIWLSTTTKVYICSSVYCDEKGNESIFPNSYSKHKSSTLAFQKVYWECAAVMFGSSVRYNPDATHYLFTNKMEAPGIYKEILGNMGVSTVQLPFKHMPPDGWHHAYKNSVYTLDMIQYLASIMHDEDIAIILDADTVWIRSFQNLVQAIREHGSLQLHISYPEEHVINGLSLKEAQEIYESLLERKLEHIPVHTGGEIVAATGLYIKQIAREIDPLWQQMIQRFSHKQTTFNTEEHFLSFIYHKLAIQHNALPFIRRIGTDETILRNVDGKELGLTIWHLPAEKPRGFKILFKLVQDKKSIFWSIPADQFTLLCAKACHILG